MNINEDEDRDYTQSQLYLRNAGRNLDDNHGPQSTFGLRFPFLMNMVGRSLCCRESPQIERYMTRSHSDLLAELSQAISVVVSEYDLDSE